MEKVNEFQDRAARLIAGQAAAMRVRRTPLARSANISIVLLSQYLNRKIDLLPEQIFHLLNYLEIPTEIVERLKNG
jgi:hypothetical protein